MQATYPPWWAQVARDLWRKHQKPIYIKLPRDSNIPIRHIVRLEGPIIIPTPPTSNWMLRYRPLDTDPWSLPIPVPSDVQQFRVDTVTSRSARTPRPTSDWWGGGGSGGSTAALGWAAGVVLLALLVFLVRAMEKCLDRRLFKTLETRAYVQTDRQESEEWPAPNVRATSHPDGRPDINGDAFIGPNTANDLPPPYSECASTSANVGPKLCEDPPPPYSTCYFSNNPKDTPTVHFINIQNRSETDANINTQNTDTNTSIHNGNMDGQNTHTDSPRSDLTERVRVEIENETHTRSMVV